MDDKLMNLSIDEIATSLKELQTRKKRQMTKTMKLFFTGVFGGAMYALGYTSNQVGTAVVMISAVVGCVAFVMSAALIIGDHVDG